MKKACGNCTKYLAKGQQIAVAGGELRGRFSDKEAPKRKRKKPLQLEGNVISHIVMEGKGCAIKSIGIRGRLC